jgi:hypothetical protein
VFGLRGGGGTIAFTFSRFIPSEVRTAWLVLPRRGSKCPAGADWQQRARATCRRLSDGDGGVTAAVDRGRVVVVTPGGNVRLLSTSDRVLRAWTLPPPVDQVRLNGRTLAVQRGASVTLYDTRTGTATRTLPLSPDEGTPVLLDEQAGLIAYATGARFTSSASRTATIARSRSRARPRRSTPSSHRAGSSSSGTGCTTRARAACRLSHCQT